MSGLDRLRNAVEPFTPRRIADEAGIELHDLVIAARTFAGARRGYVSVGTGPNMSASGTLIEYLALCLDTVCGHWMRAGERVVNALTTMPGPAQPAKAQAMSPFPSVGVGRAMRVRGLSQSIVGPPAGALADEILMPGDGQIRALLSFGGNPASAIPDQLKVIDALSSLDLLVQSDVQMSTTAQLADYVLPSRIGYEVPGTSQVIDFLAAYGNGWGSPQSYGRFTPALIAPPADSEVEEQWMTLYLIAQRMGLTLSVKGLGGFTDSSTDGARELDMARPPGNDELLEIVHAGSRVPLHEIRSHEGGALYPEPAVYVEPKDSAWEGRLEVGDPTMLAELARDLTAHLSADSEAYPFRLLSRRVKYVVNSPSLAMPTSMPRWNPAFLHSDDLDELGLKDGDLVEIESPRAAVFAVVKADDTMRTGTVSMTHGFGSIEHTPVDAREHGANSGRLVADDDVYDPFSGQPRMSNIPIRVSPVR